MNEMSLKITAFILIFLLSACQQSIKQVGYQDSSLSDDVIDVWELDSGQNIEETATPFQPETDPLLADDGILTDDEGAAEEVETSNTGMGESKPKIWIEAYIPGQLRDVFVDSEVFDFAQDLTTADSVFLQGSSCELGSSWVYTLVVPFPTPLDNAKLDDVRNAWLSGDSSFIFGYRFLVSDKVSLLLNQHWGQGSSDIITVVAEGELLESAWEIKNTITILPFEELSPRWKVLALDGVSPLDQEFLPDSYGLTIHFCLTGYTSEFSGDLDIPVTNRDQAKFTSVVLTGVTALVRAIAHKMEIKGVTYPGEMIEPLLLDADFTHISNEVAFASNCPYPNPYQTDLRFCSSPNYFDLLTHLDIDIIELTGNHIQDWGREPFLETLTMYQQAEILYYAGGVDAAEARKPLLLEHNGNKLAFLGCNAVGPVGAWATDYLSGNLPCGDYTWLKEDIAEVSTMGYLPIVTLQHNEFYSLMITGPQVRDFNPLAAAGAVIVSGSQAHYPNPFGFVGDHFIHYGLGNLFFDQMDAFVADGIQRQFVDRHIFYDGRYISTEVYTLYLEDFSQPRFMSDAERMLFLEETFLASGWK